MNGNDQLDNLVKNLAQLMKENMSMVTALDVSVTDNGIIVGVRGDRTPARGMFIEIFGEPAYREIIGILKDTADRVGEAIQGTGKVKDTVAVDADAVRAQAREEAEKA